MTPIIPGIAAATNFFGGASEYSPERFFARMWDALQQKGVIDNTPRQLYDRAMDRSDTPKEPKKGPAVHPLIEALEESKRTPRTPPGPTAQPTRPPLGPVANIEARRASPRGTDLGFEAIGKEMSAMAEAQARAGYTPGARDSLEQAYRKFLSETKREEKNPLNTRALSDAVLSYGTAMLGSKGRGTDKALDSLTKSWMEGRNREEARSEKDYERKIQQEMTAFGFRDKDQNYTEEQRKAKAAIDQALAGAKSPELAMKLEALKKSIDISEKEKDRAVDRARVGAAARPTLEGQMAEYDAAVKKYGADVVNQFLQKGRDPYKFDEKANEYFAARLETALAEGGNDRARAMVRNAYDAVLAQGGTPQQAYNAALAQMKPK